MPLPEYTPSQATVEYIRTSHRDSMGILGNHRCSKELPSERLQTEARVALTPQTYTETKGGQGCSETRRASDNM